MGRPKRVLLFVHSYYLRDTRARRHGTAFGQHGWQVDVVCARDKGEPLTEKLGPVRIWRLPSRRRGGAPARKAFEYASFAFLGLFAVTALWLYRRHRLVYVLGMPNFIVFAALVPRLIGARVLLDMRDPFPEFFLAKYEASDRHPLRRVLLLEERLSARFASFVLTVVPSLAELFRRSVRPGGLAVVYNSADPTLFQPRPVRSESDDRTLLYVGSVTYPYGVDLAVRAVARLRDQIPGIRIHVVGQGDLFPKLEEIARSEGITDRVKLEPSVPLDRVPRILEGAWLGVQPNRPSPLMVHSLSTKILEWCKVGLPVVVGRTPPLAEIFGEDGPLFSEPGDLDSLCARVVEAHEDPVKLASRVESAQRSLERISFEEQIAAFLRVAEAT